MNSTGLVGDTIVFMYSADLEIQKKNYGELEPYNCPDSVRDIINEVKAGHTYIYDSWTFSEYLNFYLSYNL